MNAIQWEITIPLLSNRYMIRDIGLVLGFSLLVVLIVMVSILIGNDNMEALGTVLRIFGIVALVMVAGFALTMGLLFRNRMRLFFRVDKKGVHYASIDRWINTLGSLSEHGDSLPMQTFHPWESLSSFSVDTQNRVLHFRNKWRVVQRVYCTKENFEAVRSLAEKGMKK